MNAHDRIVAVLIRARIVGGWDDDAVAADVLKALGLDKDGQLVPRPSISPETLANPPVYLDEDGNLVSRDQAPTSSNLGHG